MENKHPTKAVLSEEDFVAWPNCSVPDCENKVTHYSDKCYPHTHGWDAVRGNLLSRIGRAERRQKRQKSRSNLEEIKWCQSELERIKNFR